MDAPVILTIDDERFIRESFRKFLEDQDFVVHEAENGERGLQVFEEIRPDLVMVDLRMPGIDGLEVLRRVQSISPDTPLIVISGTGVIDDAIEALRCGAWDYLLKPIADLNVLLHAVNTTLERARLIKENRQHQQSLEDEVKRRTNEIEAAYQSKQISDAKFIRIFEASPDTIMISRASDGIVIDVNPTFTRIFGYTREEALGKTTSDLKVWNCEADRLRLRDTLIPNGEAVNLDMTFRTKDGTPVSCLYSGRTFDMNGETCIIGVVRDLTAQRQLESQLIQAQKMESVGRLAGGVAHDFNNLLTPILGYTELVMSALDENDPQLAHLREVHRAAENAKNLTRQLLAFGRKQLMQMRPLNLNEVVRDFGKIIRRTVREDVLIETNFCDDMGTIRGDQSQLEQILMNLAVNAQDAMPTGGTLSISTELAEIGKDACYSNPHLQPGDYAVLRIGDTGCGMSPEIRRQIFEPFFTTKEAGKGTGLGLSTVYGIARQHEGYVSVESEPGSGTTFKIYLPLIHEEAKPEAEKSAAPAPQGHETVLVVEDNYSVRRLIGKVLTANGYTVIDAEEPNACLEIAPGIATPPDMLLTDVIMPFLNGHDLYLELNKRWPGLKVAYMSGYTNDAIARHGVLDSGTHFLQKPFDVHTLLERVRETLDSPPPKPEAD